MQTGWKYAELPETFQNEALEATQCIFCFLPLVRSRIQVGEAHGIYLAQCPQCGWWRAKRVDSRRGSMHAGYLIETSTGYGILKKLSLDDLSVPVDEVINYLRVHFANINKLHPRKLEEVVAGIFKDLGYIPVVTSYSGDKGIDIFLHSPAAEVIGVQVKRYQNKIEPAQIRELTGSLMLNHTTKGIFVTTSSFTKGAKDTAAQSKAGGIPIKLMDAQALYEALALSQLHNPRDPVSFLTPQMLERFTPWDNFEGELDDDGTALHYD